MTQQEALEKTVELMKYLRTLSELNIEETECLKATLMISAIVSDSNMLNAIEIMLNNVQETLTTEKLLKDINNDIQPD